MELGSICVRDYFFKLLTAQNNRALNSAVSGFDSAPFWTVPTSFILLSTKFIFCVSLAWLFDELADQQRQVRLGYFHLACRSWWRCWPFQYRYHVQKDPWTPAFLSRQAGHQFIKSEAQRWSSSEWMFQNGIGRELHDTGPPIISQTRTKTLRVYTCHLPNNLALCEFLRLMEVNWLALKSRDAVGILLNQTVRH